MNLRSLFRYELLRDVSHPCIDLTIEMEFLKCIMSLGYYVMPLWPKNKVVRLFLKKEKCVDVCMYCLISYYD